MITPSRRNIFTLCLLCFLLSFSLRVYGVQGSVPQADELHWMKRSAELLERVRTRNVLNFSTHMTHPGLVPGFLMASGQLIAEKYNKAKGYSGDEPEAIRLLDASRLMCAAFAALLIPLLFLFAYPLLGVEAGFLAAALLALDPHHLGLSRQAHLDATLTFLVCLTVFSYWKAAVRGSTLWKLLAGVFWGLSVATKPTAVALPLVFLLFNFIRNLLVPKEGKSRVKVISFSDIAAIGIGHLIFALLYTRLWVHESEYKLRIGVKSQFADYVYECGMYLAAHPRFASAILLFLFLASLGSRYLKQQYRHFVSCSLLTLGILTTSLLFVPQVLENLIRFWTWVAGLSGEKHEAYGMVWDAPEHGYLLLYFSELPSFVCLSAVLGIFVFLLDVKRSRDATPLKSFMLISLITIVIWTLLLSISAKQTLRYVLPVVPLIYLFSAYAYKRILEFFLERESTPVAFLQKLGTPLIFLFHLFALFSWWPNFNHFYNAISGGLPAAVGGGRGLAIAGANEALQYLQQQTSFGRRDEVWVALAADKEVFSYQNRTLFPQDNRIRFLNREDSGSDFLLLSPQFASRLPAEPIQQLAQAEPSFLYQFKGAELLSIHPAPVRRYTSDEEPYVRRVHHIRHATGKVLKHKPSISIEISGETFPISKTVVLVPRKNKAAFALLSEYVRVLPGSYSFDLYTRLPFNVEVPPDLSDERYVLRMEFGRCHRIITLGDLERERFKPLSVSCNFTEAVRPQLRAYWFGNVPAELAALQIRAEDSSTVEE